MRVRSAALLAGAAMALLAGACSDGDAPTEPGPDPAPPALTEAVTCNVSVAREEVRCGAPAGTGPRASLIVGGQNQYVKLAAFNVRYDSLAGRFRFDATIRNLIEQPMGTLDGVTPVSRGIRVFFHVTPVATAVADPSGPQIVTVLGDGESTFTGSAQPYYEYSYQALGLDDVLREGEESAARIWDIEVPKNVTAFAFSVYVDAPVPGPTGYVDVTPGRASMGVGDSLDVAWVVKSPVGTPLPGETPTWTSADPSIASVDAGGRIVAHRPGLTSVTGTAGDRKGTVPIFVMSLGAKRYTAMSAQGENGCAVDAERDLYCWGHGAYGQLGIRQFPGWAAAPVKVLNAPWDTVAVSFYTTCALKEGAAWCWGSDQWRALGAETAVPGCFYFTTWKPECGGDPVPVQGGHRFVQLTAGGQGNRTIGPPYSRWGCGVKESGEVWCWGGDGDAELGDGAQYPLENPVPRPVASAVAFRQVSAGMDHTCGIDGQGAAYCWGSELAGEIGNDARLDDAVARPSAVQGGHRFRQVEAGRAHSCGVTLDGQVMCWGYNGFGQLGTTAAPDCTNDPRWPWHCSPVPLPAQTPARFVQVAAGLNHTCAIATDGIAWCWGLAVNTGVGNPNHIRTVPCPTDNLKRCVVRPVPVGSSRRFVQLDAGYDFTCGLTTTGDVYCWGGNFYGLGRDGHAEYVPMPIREPGPPPAA